MGTMQWLGHLRDSVQRERDMDFTRGVTLSEPARAATLRALQFFQRGLSSPGMNLRSKVRQGCPEEYIECIDLYVREKGIHADLLARLIWAMGGEPGKRNVPDFVFRRFRRRFGWTAEIMVLLTAEMVMAPVLRVMVNHVDDPLVRDVVSSILADQAWHIGFHIDHLRPEVRAMSGVENFALQAAWGALFTTTLTVLLAECEPLFESIGYSRLTCWTDAWNLFAQVQTGLNGSDHLNAILSRDPRIRFAL